MKLVTATFLSTWEAFSAERGEAGPRITVVPLPPSACSHRVRQSLRPGSQPVQPHLSLSESSLLAVAGQKCFHW